MIRQLGFPNAVFLLSKDMDVTTAFFLEKLGFQMLDCWPDRKAPRWANLVLNGQVVILGAAMKPNEAGLMYFGKKEAEKMAREMAREFKAHPAGVGVLFYMEVLDVDAYYHSLLEKGVPDLSQPRTHFDGTRSFQLKTPDGYRFMFYSDKAA